MTKKRYIATYVALNDSDDEVGIPIKAESLDEALLLAKAETKELKRTPFELIGISESIPKQSNLSYESGQLKNSALEHIELADAMTDYDAYAYLQLLNTTAWQYITSHYDSDYKIGNPMEKNNVKN